MVLSSAAKRDVVCGVWCLEDLCTTAFLFSVFQILIGIAIIHPSSNYSSPNTR